MYKNCINKDDKDWTRAEEIRKRDIYGFKTMENQILHELICSR